MDLDHCLYISRFSGTLGDTGLRGVLQQARDNNLRHAVTGVLLFDGERFVQLIEGPSERVRALTALLASDIRHGAFQPLIKGPSDARRYPGWQAGYAELDAVDRFVLEMAEAAGNTPVMLAAFDRLVRSADLE